MLTENKKGQSFIGIILILMLVAVMAGAGMDFYIALAHRRAEVEQRYTAVNLAAAQLEDLLAIDRFSDARIIGNPVSMNAGPGWTRWDTPSARPGGISVIWAAPAPGTTLPSIPAGYTVQYFVTNWSFGWPNPWLAKYIVVDVTYPPRGALIEIFAIKTAVSCSQP